MASIPHFTQGIHGLQNTKTVVKWIDCGWCTSYKLGVIVPFEEHISIIEVYNQSLALVSFPQIRKFCEQKQYVFAASNTALGAIFDIRFCAEITAIPPGFREHKRESLFSL